MRMNACLLLCAFGLLPVQAEPQATPSGDAAPIRALLEEVRLLRLAIEKSATLVPRLQVTLARFQAQQERVDRLERDLHNLHNQIATETGTREAMTANAARFDEQARQTQDPNARKQLEDAAAAVRRDLEQQAQRDQLVRMQDSDLSAQLKSEQARLNELSNQLDQLEKKLED
jgi:hypothetical protein